MKAVRLFAQGELSRACCGRQARRGHVPQNTTERLFFGHGAMGDFNELAMGADWEFDDGTPAPKTAVQNFTERNLKFYVESIIDACATVEEMAEKNQLPLRPGTDEIRRFDPMCPLYLPINDIIMDESTSVPVKHEIYADRAPYYDPTRSDADTVLQGPEPSIHDAGDGTAVNATEADVIKQSKSRRSRRKKVVQIKQHWSTTQPLGRPGPFNMSDKPLFDVGHKTPS
ncbi:hypothetical protein DIPPA_22113 [Diplonema papillatum]|nr:hypothetical protein DIPPA_22113 [Diplonema papillatum]